MQVDLSSYSISSWDYNDNKKTNSTKMSAPNLDPLKQDTVSIDHSSKDNNNKKYKKTGWVVIPSKKNVPQNFEENVKKLEELSHKNMDGSIWAKECLSDGDCHIYLENGTPKVSIMFEDDQITDIQGEFKTYGIPISYLDEIQKHIDENRLDLTYKIVEEIEYTQNAKRKANKIKKLLTPNNQPKSAIESLCTKIKKCFGSTIKPDDVKSVFNYFGIKAEEDKDGFLTISEYYQPDEFTFSDCGIDENKLLEKVKRINGNADFRDSQATNLDNLKSIGGNADFRYSQIKDIDHIKIDGDIYFL